MPDNDALRSRSLVFPVLLVAIGTLFLIRTWQPAFHPWPVIRTYWPLILVFVGLGKMWDAFQGARQSRSGVSIGSTVGVLLFVVVIVVLLWRGHTFADHDGRYRDLVDHTSETRDLQGATSLKADLTVPAGTLDLAGGSDHGVETDFEYSAAWSRPRLDYHVSSGVAELEIAQDNRGPALGPNDDNWRLRFNKSVPLDIRLKMGVGKGDLRFRDANLQKLFIEVGVGKVDIDLTGERKADVNVGIHGGIGQAVIHLPKNVGVVVEAKKGIGAVTTEGLKSQDGNYVNDAYGKSPHTIHIFAEAGIGNIDLSVEP